MVGYASEQAHSCIWRAFDMLGICKDNLRSIKCNDNYEMDIDALKAEIEKTALFAISLSPLSARQAPSKQAQLMIWTRLLISVKRKIYGSMLTARSAQRLF